MAFTSPTISLPSALNPGWIYFLREEDYLDQSIGRYVKIGLTSRTVPIRIGEHQTGNPRREFETIPSSYIELMDYGETYLHHYFAAGRLCGEWFDFDDSFLASDVVPVINNLESEMAIVAGSFRRWKELNDIPSNSAPPRTATPTEARWGREFTAAYEQLTVAKAILDTHKNNLKNILGNNKGIENIMHIKQKTRNPTFNQNVFEGILTAAQLSQCNTPTTSWSRSLKMLNKGRDLATLNPTVQLAFDASEMGLVSPSATNMAGALLPLTQAIRDENLAMLNAMRNVKIHEWECLKAQAKLVEALDDSLEIDGILKWKREQNTSLKFDRKLAKSLFETEFNASFRPPSTPYSYSTEFDYNRKYAP